jgi:hypothetical protein
LKECSGLGRGGPLGPGQVRVGPLSPIQNLLTDAGLGALSPQRVQGRALAVLPLTPALPQ